MSRSGARNRYRLGTVHALAAALATLPGTAAALRLDYSVDLGVERNDNVAMTPIDPVEEDILRAGLDFALTHDTAVIQASLAGRAEYRDYLGDAYDDTLDGTAQGRLNWFALEGFWSDAGTFQSLYRANRYWAEKKLGKANADRVAAGLLVV